jgi:hypothetical protein
VPVSTAGFLLALLLVGCSAPRPRNAAAMVANETPCADGIRSSVDRWTTEVLGPAQDPPYPADPSKLVVRRRGDLRVLPVPRTVPRGGGAPFALTYGARVDRDGTVIFVGENRRSGRGIYRWEAGRVVPLVDGSTRISGQSTPLCIAGAPDIDHGRVVFQGCGRTIGVYLWTPRGIVTIATEDSGPVTLRNGRVLFRSAEDGRERLLLWSEQSRSLEPVLSEGDVVPDSSPERIEHIDEYAMSDGTITALVSSEPFAVGKQGRLRRRHLVQLRRGRVSSIFRDIVPGEGGSLGPPRFTVDADATAFELRGRDDGSGIRARSSVWFARGCERERVIASGERLGEATVVSARLPRPPWGSLEGEALHLDVRLSTGETVRARARRRAEASLSVTEAAPARAFADRVAPFTLECVTSADCSMLEAGRCCRGFCEADGHGPGEPEDPDRGCVP